MVNGEVTLPCGVSWVGRGQTLADVETGAEGRQRGGEVALLGEPFADVDTDNGEVSLPGGVPRVGRGQAMADIENWRGRPPARRRSPCSLSTMPIFSWVTERPCWKLAFPGSAAARRWSISRLARKAASAAATSPCSLSTSPILLWLTERSRCHSAFPGSAAARRCPQSIREAQHDRRFRNGSQIRKRFGEPLDDKDGSRLVTLHAQQPKIAKRNALPRAIGAAPSFGEFFGASSAN